MSFFGLHEISYLASLTLFCAGSAICGASHNVPMMLLGRSASRPGVKRNHEPNIVSLFKRPAIQGLGDGGIISLSEIVVADLVPLSERGKWEGVLGVVWAIGKYFENIPITFCDVS